MVNEHLPWGGGAPNRDVRVRNLEQRGIYPDVGQDCRKIPFSHKILKRTPRSGGGGAPIRSSCGHLVTSFHDDPILGFNDPLRNYVDLELRYKVSPRVKKHYKMQLDKLVEEKQMEKARRKKKSLELDKKISLIREPWGRPGPGGNPWRDPRSVGNKFLKSLGWTDKSDLQHIDHSSSWAPFSKIPEEPESPPQRQRESNPQPQQTALQKPQSQSICCKKCACVCLNEFLSQESNNLKRDKLGGSAQSLRELKNIKEERKPIKKSNTNPQIITKHRNKNCIIEPKARPCMITAGAELVPLLARRRASQRPVSLSTTDITRYKDHKTTDQWQDGGIQYLTELNRQIKRREYDTRLRKEFDVETSKQHFETWDTFWGRPGYGAPKNVKNKLNLDQLLFRAPNFVGNKAV